MIEIEPKEGISLRNATGDELIKAFVKYDRYFDYGPKLNRSDYLDKISNILLEIRMRKNMGESISARNAEKSRIIKKQVDDGQN